MNKPILLNPFNVNQRRLLQFGIVFTLMVFFGILYFIFKQNIVPETSGVVLSDSKLQVFNDTFDNFNYPDRLNVHYPYLLVIQPEKTLTTIYNLEKRTKENTFKQVLLDYDGKNSLTNGKETFLNQIGLEVSCSSAYVKSEQEILCATTNSQSEVLSIDPVTKAKRVIYQASNLITTVSYFQDKLYVGEMNMTTNKSYLVTDRKKIEVPTPVNLVYHDGNKIFIASFKGLFTKDQLVSYSLSNDSSVRKYTLGEIIILR